MPTTRCGRLVAPAIAVTDSARVRGQDRLRLDDPVQRGKECALGLQLLDDRLDHEVAPAEVCDVSGQPEPPERRVALVLREPSLLDAARQVVLDRRAAPLAELLGDLAADGLEAGLDAELRDTGAHRAQPDDRDLGDLHPAILAFPRGLRPLAPDGP